MVKIKNYEVKNTYKIIMFLVFLFTSLIIAPLLALIIFGSSGNYVLENNVVCHHKEFNGAFSNCSDNSTHITNSYSVIGNTHIDNKNGDNIILLFIGMFWVIFIIMGRL